MTVIRDKATPACQAAQTRGRIQKGLDGDKVPGFDPAAAPLETDAEAGGSSDPLPPETPSDTPRTNRDAHASSHAEAMRPIEGAVQPRAVSVWWFLLAIVAIGVAFGLLFLRT